jgi:1-aminocyclopropane-1-carboxylate deaminase/D-cysteine desulfhydrase-like pyridoxal-dependent ACC family enzyme
MDGNDVVLLSPYISETISKAEEKIGKKLKMIFHLNFFSLKSYDDQADDESAYLSYEFEACDANYRHRQKKTWEEIKDEFLKTCEKSKIIILHDWLPVGNCYQAWQAMADLAKKILEEINPDAQIFALPQGGTYDAPVHKIKGVEKIFSLADEPLIKAIKKLF